MTETMNVRGESGDNGGSQMIEKKRLSLCTITLPPSKTCTTGTRLDSLWVSIVEDDTTAGVLWEGAIHNDMSWVIAKGTESVWTVVGSVAEVAAKRTVVAQTVVLGMATINTKMPCSVAVKTNSFQSCCHGWAQAGVSKNNLSGIRHSMGLRSDSS